MKTIHHTHPVRGEEYWSRYLVDAPRTQSEEAVTAVEWLCERLAITLISIILLASVLLLAPAAHANTSRIKDIVAFEGVRENMLIGYGLVVGLNGTGDKLKNTAFTEQSLIAFLERQGVNTRGTELKTKNVAAVTVTASLAPFARSGSRLDVSLSAMGDAKSLMGGTLLATPLYGADGQVYAVAQGGVTIGGFEASGDSGTSITKGVPTSGIIANGAVVENEVPFALNNMKDIRLALRNPDLTTAQKISEVINSRIGPDSAIVLDPGTVTLKVPANYDNAVAYLLADIEQLPVETDTIAKVVIDEDSGTIVMGENVRIDTVAVAQGNLVVKVEENPQVSQPNPFAPVGAETVVVPRSEVSVSEDSDAKMTVLDEGASLKELVAGLNALGVGPRDLITILQTIKAAGALQADIEVR
jgi:flagellar P-ring protein FlgI